MKRTVVMLSLTLAAGIILSMVGSHVLHAQQEPIKRTVLVKSDLEGIEGKEAILFLAELAPGAVGGKHYHPGTEVFYAVEGAFTHEPEGKPPVTLRQGQAGISSPCQNCCASLLSGERAKRRTPMCRGDAGCCASAETGTPNGPRQAAREMRARRIRRRGNLSPHPAKQYRLRDGTLNRRSGPPITVATNPIG